MKDSIHRVALRVYRHLPVGFRRRLVRAVSPSYTVGAMCFIERSDGAILLVRHLYRDGWGVPGGLVQRGEGSADAARRETFEETNLEVRLIGEPAVVVDPQPQRVDVIFRADLLPGSVDTPVISSPELTDARWFPPDELPDLQFETANAMVALARSARSPQAHSLSPPVPPSLRRDAE